MKFTSIHLKAGRFAALVIISTTPAAFGSSINYLSLNAASYASNTNGTPGGVQGVLAYNTATGGTATASGNTTYSEPTAPGLTSATIQTSSSDVVTCGVPPMDCVPGTLTASALATGNLAAGSVGVYAFPMYLGADESTQAVASAILQDTLTFHVAGATNSTVTDIGVSFMVDGSINPGDPTLGGGAELTDALEFGGVIKYVYDSAGISTGTQNDIVENSGWLSSAITSESANSFIFSGVYQFTGASEIVPLVLELSLNCTSDASCDVSHTGAIGLSLPSGVTFTSASGALLSQASAVPEPGPQRLIFLGLGLLLVPAVLRRLRRTTS